MADTQEDEMVAKYDFVAASETELPLKRGETVVVLTKDDSGWAQGELADGKKGWFPWEFVVTRAEFEAAEARKRRKQLAKQSVHVTGSSTGTLTKESIKAATEGAAEPHSASQEHKTLPVPGEKHAAHESKDTPPPKPLPVPHKTLREHKHQEDAAPAPAVLPPQPQKPAPVPQASQQQPLPQLPQTPKGPQSSGMLELFVSTADQATLWHTLMSSAPVKTVDSTDPEPQRVADQEEAQLSSRPVSTSSVLREYTEQFELLLISLNAEQGRVSAAFSPRKTERARELPVEIVFQKLAMIRNVLVQYSMIGDMLATVIDSIQKLCDKFVDQVSGNVKPPSSKDRDGTEDDDDGKPGPHEAEELTDNSSPLFFLYKTFRCILEANARNPATCSEIARLPPRVRETFFEKIHFQNRPAVRQQAGLCLGFVSTQQLDPVVQLFSSKLVLCKSSDQFREFVTYQYATSHIAFGFSKQPQIEPTSHFFNAVAISMEKIDRAVLKNAVCKSLVTIIDNIFQKNASRCPEFDDRAAQKFWNCFDRIFELAKKWIKSDKTKMSALRLLVSMLSAEQSFFVSHGDEFLQVLVPQLKDSSIRKALLEYTLHLLKTAFGPKPVPQQCSSVFSGFADTLICGVLPSRSEAKKNGFPVQNEVSLLTDIMIEIGRRGVRIADQKTVRLALSADFPPEVKAVLFKAFSVLYNESNETLTESIDRLYPQIAPYFGDFQVEGSPSRPVLHCFPGLCKPEEQERIAAKVVPLMSESSSETQLMATNAIINWIKLRPASNLTVVLDCMLDNLKGFTEMPVERLLNSIKPVCTILDLSQNFFSEDNQRCTIDVAKWAMIREQYEGICLSLILSNEPVVWTKALLMAEALKKPVFVKIEEHVEHAPYLIDSFQNVDNSASGWNAHLTAFLKSKGSISGEYRRAVSWAWEKLSKSWSTKMPNWTTVVRFLLLSIRISPDDDTKVQASFIRDLIAHLGIVVNALSAEYDKGTKDAKKKSKPFFAQENAITILSRAIINMPGDVYAASETARSLYRAFVAHWIDASAAGLEGYHPAIKSQVCSVFQSFLLLEGHVEDARKASGEAASAGFTIREHAYSESLFNLLAKLLGSAQDGPSKSSTFEVSIVKAVSVLVQCSDVNPEFLAGTVLPFLCDALKVGPHMVDEVSLAFVFALKRNPGYLAQFIERSFQFRSRPAESFAYLDAVVTNVIQDFDTWKSSFPPSKMLAFALLQVCACALRENVTKANSMINFLVTLRGSPFAASPVPVITRVWDNQPFLRSRNAQIVSTGLAAKAVPETAEFVSSVDGMVDYLDDASKGTALTIVIPWAANFHAVVASKDADKTKRFLAALVSLTVKCSEPAMQALVEQIWQSATSQKAPQDIEAIVSTFVAMSAESPSDRKVYEGISTALTYIGRTPNVLFVFQYLSQSLRTYKAPSYHAQEFVTAVVKNPIPFAPEGNVKEAKAFCLLADLLVEQVANAESQIAAMLQSAFVLHSPSRTSGEPLRKEAESVVNSLLSGVLTRDDEGARAKADALLKKKNKWSVEDMNKFLDLVSPTFPRMRDQWSEQSLDWALMMVDESCAVDSLHLAHALTARYEGPRVLKLLMCLFKYVAYWQTRQRAVLSEMLSRLPLDLQESSQSVWKCVAQAGGALLHTSSISQYNQGCEILKNTFRVPAKEHSRLCVDLDLLWPTVPEVTSVVVRGLACQATYQNALWLCETLANGPRRSCTTALLQIATLTHMLLIFIKSRDAVPNAMKFASCCVDSGMTAVAEAFSKADMRAVPVHLQRDSSDIMSDIFRAYSAAFKGPEDFLVSMDTVLVLLRRGQKRWRSALLEILGKLVSMGVSPTRTQLLQLSELVILYTHSADAQVATSAIGVLSYVFKNIPEGVAAKLFDCIRTLPQDVYVQRDPDVFLGDCDDDVRGNTFTCSKKLLSVLGVAAPPSFNESFLENQRKENTRYSQENRGADGAEAVKSAGKEKRFFDALHAEV
eukprot:m51a1_g701 hypothetical protein (1984) ;mRNA; r:375981-383870